MTPILGGFCRATLPRDSHTSPIDFPSSCLLARILEGDDPSIQLRQALEVDGDLRRALRRIPHSKAQDLRESLGDQLEALLSLSQESLGAHFFEALFQIAQRLESQDRFEMAGRIYMAIVALNRRSGVSPELQGIVSRAEARLELFQGRGSWGDRFEFWGGRVAQQAMDPALLIGMGLGTLAYRSVRAAYCLRTLRWIAEAERTGYVIVFLPARHYGIGARVLSGGLGIAAEAPAFVLGHRLSHWLMGRGDRPDLYGSLGSEVASSYLMLGGLRLFGGIASVGARRVLRIEHLESATFLRRAVHEGAVQAGMFGGLILAHVGEAELGLRPRYARSRDILGDSLRMLFQANLMRPVARGLLGGQIHANEQSILEGNGIPPG